MKRALKAVLRPIYKAFFEQPLWWFLLRVRTFFFAETLDRLAAIEGRLAAFDHTPKYDHFVDHLQAQSLTQWNAIEQLLLAILSQPRVEPAPGVVERAEVAAAPKFEQPI